MLQVCAGAGDSGSVPRAAVVYSLRAEGYVVLEPEKKSLLGELALAALALDDFGDKKSQEHDTAYLIQVARKFANATRNS